jgi:hypothetical protein
MSARRMNLRQWALFALLLVLPLLFQNCGNGGFLKLEDINTQQSSMDAFFDYPYTAKPDYFVNVQVSSDPGMTKFGNMAVMASLTPADGSSQSIPYQLKVLDTSNAPVCPAQTGTFASGADSVSFMCTPAGGGLTSVVVELTFTPPGGAAQTLRWTY